MSEGSVTYACSETKTEIIVVLGHFYGAWEEVKTASTTEEGVREAVNSRCGEKTEIIIKLTADDSTNVKVEKIQTSNSFQVLKHQKKLLKLEIKVRG